MTEGRALLEILGAADVADAADALSAEMQEAGHTIGLDVLRATAQALERCVCDLEEAGGEDDTTLGARIGACALMILSVLVVANEAASATEVDPCLN